MEINVEKLIEWDAWATAKIMASLAQLPQSEVADKAWCILAHQVNAQLLWLHRMGHLQGTVPAATIWPEADERALPGLLQIAKTGWQQLVATAQPNQIFTYTNSRGEPFESTLADIATHILFHGQYHRGQVNQLIRLAGGTPAPVDYIFYARTA